MGEKLGLCPRPQDFQGMAPVSTGRENRAHSDFAVGAERSAWPLQPLPESAGENRDRPKRRKPWFLGSGIAVSAINSPTDSAEEACKRECKQNAEKYQTRRMTVRANGQSE